MESNFGRAVVEIMKAVPYGKVVSYGQVAVYAGVPRAARAVGWFLRSFDFAQDKQQLPWWRVVNNAGRISIINWDHPPEEQRDRLRAEGVEVSDNYELDIEKYRFIF